MSPVDPLELGCPILEAMEEWEDIRAHCWPGGAVEIGTDSIRTGGTCRVHGVNRKTSLHLCEWRNQGCRVYPGASVVDVIEVERPRGRGCVAEEVGVVGCQCLNFPVMRGVVDTVDLDDLDAVASQAFSRVGVEKLGVGISFPHPPKLPALLLVCGALANEEGELLTTKTSQTVFTCAQELLLL